MTISVNKSAYKAFGLRILSEIPFVEVPETDTEFGIDVVIELVDLSAMWDELAKPGSISVIKKDFFMLNLPGIGKFCVQQGKKISVSPEKGYDEEQIRLYILGTCMGALLLQRKVLTLHGSAVAIEGKAYAFVGDSGAGKSSLAAAFLDRGHDLLSDDLIPVNFDGDSGIPYVIPSYPQQKLWQDCLKQFGMQTDSYRPIFKRETKFAIPLATNFFSNPLPLAGIFEITKTDEEDVEAISIEGLQRLHTFFQHTYRNFLIRDLGLMEWHFNTSAKILSRIEIFQLRRPQSTFTVHKLVDLVLTRLSKEP